MGFGDLSESLVMTDVLVDVGRRRLNECIMKLLTECFFYLLIVEVCSKVQGHYRHIF